MCHMRNRFENVRNIEIDAFQLQNFYSSSKGMFEELKRQTMINCTLVTFKVKMRCKFLQISEQTAKINGASKALFDE